MRRSKIAGLLFRYLSGIDPDDETPLTEADIKRALDKLVDSGPVMMPDGRCMQLTREGDAYRMVERQTPTAKQ